MNYESMPRIRLEVESMKTSILSHLGVHGSDLGRQLDAEITRAIESYDWHGQVSAIVHAALREKIEHYFKYGEGAKAIQDAVSEGFAAAMAQQIPDLEAELREVLGSMGYDLVARSPFVEPEAAVEPDMSDWRNWRDNDLIMLKDGIKSGNAIIAGEKYQITHKTKDGFWIDTKMQGSIHIMGRVGDFRFHSRPAKGEK